MPAEIANDEPDLPPLVWEGRLPSAPAAPVRIAATRASELVAVPDPVDAPAAPPAPVPAAPRRRRRSTPHAA